MNVLGFSMLKQKTRDYQLLKSYILAKNTIENNSNSSCMNSLQIAVATHKYCKMPDDPIYLPLHVGAQLHPEINLGFQKDNVGKNISKLNNSYCELTALYWIWQNSSAGYKGLVHYRRHFSSGKKKKRFGADPLSLIATEADFQKLTAGNIDIVLPKKRRYYIETVYDHYAHTFDCAHFDAARRILKRLEPSYVRAWDALMTNRTAYLYNMFVMQADLLDSYCAWLFPILEELEAEIDTADMDAFQARWIGRVAERLFNTWITENNLRIQELPVLSTEPINWPKKILGFLSAKFFGRKYKESF